MEGMRRMTALFLAAASPAFAQHDHGAAERATNADSAKAMAVVKELRAAVGIYADTAAAVRDGYRLFAPQLKTQKTYHFTRNSNAVRAAFRFNAGKPTSLLYEKDSTGRMKLV